MVEQEGAFLLVGGGGADQITACAQYANENGIPYLSAGVNETGLADLGTYFATTLTYAEQAPMIIAQLQEQGFTEAALVVADTPSFDDAFDGPEGRGRRPPGSTIPFETRINKDASPAESATVAQQLKDSGRRGRHPAQLAGRLRPRAGARRRQPELRAGVDRAGHHQRAQRRHRHRLPERRAPASSSRRRRGST